MRAVFASYVDGGGLGEVLGFYGELGKGSGDVDGIVLVGVDEQLLGHLKFLLVGRRSYEVGKRAHGNHRRRGRGGDADNSLGGLGDGCADDVGAGEYAHIAGGLARGDVGTGGTEAGTGVAELDVRDLDEAVEVCLAVGVELGEGKLYGLFGLAGGADGAVGDAFGSKVAHEVAYGHAERGLVTHDIEFGELVAELEGCGLEVGH